MFNHFDSEKIFNAFCGLSVGGYGFGTLLEATTWHSELLQEMSYVTAIISSILAVYTFIKNNRKKKK